MHIIFLGLLSLFISSGYAAEIEHVTKGTMGEKDREKDERTPLLEQQLFEMKPVNDLPLDIQKIICRNVKMLICPDLNIDRQSFLDAEQNPRNNWNKVKSSSLLWHYHAVQQYMAYNNFLTVGQKKLNIHDSLQLSSDQRSLMIRASKSSGSPLFYWDYIKLEKIPPHVTNGMTVIINEPAFFEKMGKMGSTQCYKGPIIVGMLCCVGTILTSVTSCFIGCPLVPVGVVAVTFGAGVSGFTVVSCCCCVRRKDHDFKKDA